MKYPIINPNVHINKLNKNKVLLTNLMNNKTKFLNRHQYTIYEMCDGTNNIDDITAKCLEDEKLITVKNDIQPFLELLIDKEYLFWSPVKVSFKPELPSNEASEEEKIVPTSLHSITIAILDACCLKCEYCSQNAPVGSSNMYSLSEIEKILIDGRMLGAKYFSIFGGEPTLHPNLCEMTKFAYSIGYRHVEISTKGTLITPEYARNLKSSGVSGIQLSVDSHIVEKYEKIVGVKGSFSKMMKGLYSLQASGINIRLKMVMTKANADEICDSVRFFNKNGITDFDIEVAVPVGRADYVFLPSEEMIKKVEQDLKNIKDELNLKQCGLTYMKYGKPKQCAGGINSVFIFADGEVGLCDKGHFIKDKLQFGNIKSNSLPDIWQSNNFESIRTMRNNSSICNSCDEASNCLGGCVLNSYIANGEPGPDPMCKKVSGLSGIFPISRC